jgi:hypothetical protein
MELRDAQGIPFYECELWVPHRAGDFPHPRKAALDGSLSLWRRRWKHCWWCGVGTEQDATSPRHGEIHHLVRHDAPFAYTWLCADCHRLGGVAVTRGALPHLLWLKWTWDHKHTSWVHLTLAHGKFLPTPERHKPV